MSIWFMIAALFLAAFVPAQVPTGPTGLVFPIPGAPLSLEQVEERSRKLPDGTSATEIIKSKIYRDSAGRMRIESNLPGPSGESFPIVSLIDPVAGSLVMLLTPAKIAGRMLAPKSGPNGFNVGFPAMGEVLPAGNWKTQTDSLGKRTIEGIEFEGTRTTRTLDDQPSLIAVDERWVSKELRLTGLAATSGPNERHTAKIQNLDRHEPDPALFTVPPDYTIQDSESLNPGQP